MDNKMPKEILIGEDTFLDLATSTMDEISPYDASYPIALLSNGLKIRMEQADAAAKAIYSAVVREMPVLAQTEQALRKGYR